jgi:hypothetical protein
MGKEAEMFRAGEALVEEIGLGSDTDPALGGQRMGHIVEEDPAVVGIEQDDKGY